MGLCGSSRCGCGLTVGDGLDLTGSGEPGDPFVVSGPGAWEHIDSGNETSGSAFVVGVSAGFSRLRLNWSGTATDDASPAIRINNDNTSNMHVRSRHTISPAGTFSSTLDGGQGSVWFIGFFLSTLPSWGVAEIDIAGPRPYMRCNAARAGIPSGSARFEGWGWLNHDRTVTSLQIRCDGDGNFSDFHWQLEGYRA